MLLPGVELKAQQPQKKILVAYFSHTGNTREVANQIKSLTGGDVYEIQTTNPYTEPYRELTERAKKEISAAYKPELKDKLKSIEAYDVIFVGSPCWWGTYAPPVATFLSSYSFSGKTIVPFMTHEGSRMGHTVADIKKLCPKAEVLEGLPVRGSMAKSSKKDVEAWLRSLKLIK